MVPCNHMKKYMRIFSIICIVVMLGVFVLQISPAHESRQSSIVSIWPEQHVVLDGSYVFKAYIPHRSLNSYDLYWSVDEKQPAYIFSDSLDEIPHKEAQVDTSLWPQQSTDTYTVRLTATEKNRPSKIIDTQLITVTKSQHTGYRTSLLHQLATAIESNETPQSSLAGVTPSDMHVIWQSEGTPDEFDQSFTLEITNVDPSRYYAFWQIGNGSYTKMRPSQDNPHRVSSYINLNSWTWKGNGPYELSFIVQDRSAQEIFRQKISIYRFTVDNTEYLATTEDHVNSDTHEAPTESPASETTSDTPSTYQTINLADYSLFIAPNTAQTVSTDNTIIKTLLGFIADQPQAIWLTGDKTDTATVSQTVTQTKQHHSLPVFVLYNIPHRDCSGTFSAGGAQNAQTYIQWLTNIITAADKTPSIFIIEPDALANSSCLSTTEKEERIRLIAQSVDLLKTNIPSKVYIDIGHPYWLSVSDASALLTQAGISKADGFALNTANYIATDVNKTYGVNLLQRLGQNTLSFVIDTSRNGNGGTSQNEWCNPADRALGNFPTLLPEEHVDAYLWIKRPGESDGTCNNGPDAGTWWLERALQLVTEMIQKQVQQL